MRDLARVIGLSASTISRALRNDPQIAPETRERVAAAAREAGYRPNALVNALMSQVRQRHALRPTGEVVAYLTAWESEYQWHNYTGHLQHFEGARRRAEDLGFRIEPMWLGPRGEQTGQVRRILEARGVRGSLLAPVPVDHKTIHLDWQNHAVVAFGYSFRQVALNRAVHDNVGLIHACYTQLHKLGYRRIGLALHRQDNVRVRGLWVTGFLGAQWESGNEPLPPHLFDDYGDSDSFMRWFEAQKPDAVIGIYKDQVLDWLAARGIRVPEDVGYATLDVNPKRHDLAGMRQNNLGLGMAAMDLLSNQLFRNDTGIPATPKITLIEGTWIDGPTAGRRKSSPPSEAIPAQDSVASANKRPPRPPTRR